MNDEIKKEWDFEDEDKTFELVQEIRHYLYEAYYNFSIVGDDFDAGLEYVVKNFSEIQGLNHDTQVELVRMGYEQLAEDMGLFSHALYAIAERGTTAFYSPSINDKGHNCQRQMDNTEPPEPPYNPMTETVDMFNFISDANNDV